MNTRDYQERALMTINPALSRSERLGMCGLGIAGEGGEIADMLKKHLYHANGKPLDGDKFKAEIGDVLWYLSVLCSLLGLTIEEVMQANIEKLEQRHGNGFVARYSSDSGVSE